MLREFSRVALIPILVAAIAAMCIASLLGQASSLGEPFRGVLVAGAGAIGGMIGSALLQANQRAEDRRRAATALRPMLDELRSSFESDTRMLLEPIANAKGEIIRQDQLLAFAKRLLRTLQQLHTLSLPAPVYDAKTNESLAALRTAADSGTSVASNCVAAAEQMPATVEDFFIALGAGRELEKLTENVLSHLKQAINHLTL